jgi:hypothetical protein
MRFSRMGLCLLISMLAASCSEDDEPATHAADAALLPGSDVDAGVSLPLPMDARSPIITIDVQRPRDAGPLTKNESFETALPVALGSGHLQDVVHFAQDNYFTFEASAGGYVDLRTSNSSYSPDVTLRLYDAQRALIAENDDGSLWPGDAVDARLVVRLPSAGRYFVEVSDANTPRDYFSDSSFSLLYYRLDVRAIEPGTPGFVFAEHGGQPRVTFALDGESGHSYVTLLGTLEAAQLDTFVFAGLEHQIMVGDVLAAGVPGHGSTAAVQQLRVLSGDQRVLAELEVAPGALKFYPPITTGDHLVTIAAPASVGANGFYAVDMVMLPDNPREQQDASNGVLAGAETLNLKGAGRRRGLLLADVPFGDVDYYTLAVAEGEQMLVSCEGQSAASGVRQLHAEIRDDKDQPLAALSESTAHELNIEAFRVPASGQLYLRLFSDPGATPQPVEAWVRCVVIIG